MNNLYKKFSDNKKEFFYDTTFDDYEKYYIIQFNKKTKSGLTYTSNILNSSLPFEVYIQFEQPIENNVTDLTKIIGNFYPNVDSTGVFGSYKIFDNTQWSNIMPTLLETCKFAPLGNGIMNSSGSITNYQLTGIYVTPIESY